ncbi:hypothetical protein D3C75_917400 [compost metagenome]|uniref:hypothetical protein n=1 Tax=Acinetobacter guillouiae TaxID=106649 RepID=UPI000FAA1512
MTTINNLTKNELSGNSGEFKAGDLVVFVNSKSDDENLYAVEAVLDDGAFLGISHYRQAFSANKIRHATPSEIKAGHRIDLKQCQHGYDIACLICGFGNENGVRVWRKQIESDDVTDIRNHVSPNTKVIDHG